MKVREQWRIEDYRRAAVAANDPLTGQPLTVPILGKCTVWPLDGKAVVQPLTGGAKLWVVEWFRFRQFLRRHRGEQ